MSQLQNTENQKQQNHQRTAQQKNNSNTVQRMIGTPPASSANSLLAQMKANNQGVQPFQMKRPSSNSNGLPDEVQAKMENSMGHDFSNVNIHKESQSATDAGALAYAQGNDVHFAPGQFKPDTTSGQELIGHELAHVVQQREDRVKPTKVLGKGMAVNDDPTLEKEADELGKATAQYKKNDSASSQVIQKQDSDPPEQKRLIFVGGSHSDDPVFNRAAVNTNNDYGDSKIDQSEFTQIETAATIVDQINSEEDESINSIDIFSHGGRDGLFFKGGMGDLYNSDADEYGDGSERSLEDIDYTNFSQNARIEIHGCNSGSIDEGEPDPFAQVLSAQLGSAGKSNAIVIAHGTYANPDAHESLSGDDYRHGFRRVFHNGEPLFSTRKEGHITQEEIDQFLNLKELQGDTYDPSTQRLH